MLLHFVATAHGQAPHEQALEAVASRSTPTTDWPRPSFYLLPATLPQSGLFIMAHPLC
ncbi:hypothetical protein Q0M94_15375 [Deinococcus radiomollis]|uniref:hypothetical protein n=1 Tax=Deinococcus radiomollis TaxID=468916 RepID=UPI0038916EBC